MKILVYGINYSPELTGIGKYTGEMVEWLAAQGHEVRVITAPPYYPGGRWARTIPPGGTNEKRGPLRCGAARCTCQNSRAP